MRRLDIEHEAVYNVLWKCFLVVAHMCYVLYYLDTLFSSKFEAYLLLFLLLFGCMKTFLMKGAPGWLGSKALNGHRMARFYGNVAVFDVLWFMCFEHEQNACIFRAASHTFRCLVGSDFVCKICLVTCLCFFQECAPLYFAGGMDILFTCLNNVPLCFYFAFFTLSLGAYLSLHSCISLFNLNFSIYPKKEEEWCY